MEQLDVEISLVPFMGATDFYASANTFLSNLAAYDLQEKRLLAKQIMVHWEQLSRMKVQKTLLFIAVMSAKPEKFLLKIDTHEQSLCGTLAPGVIEAGLVGFREITNYAYIFEMIQTQQIIFYIKLNINSDDADPFLKQCPSFDDCFIGEAVLAKKNAKVMRVSSSINRKNIKCTFTYDHNSKNSATVCQFVVGVKGKEDHGTHFELSLRESDFH